jgi:hypothetical protein
VISPKFGHTDIFNLIDLHFQCFTFKTITPVLKISTYIITSITAHPVELAAILAIMSVSTFKTAAILFDLHFQCFTFIT